MKNDSKLPAAYEMPPRSMAWRYAWIVFWVGLLVAAVNPPGQVAGFATIVATVGAFWLVGLWLNRAWYRFIRTRS